MFLDSDFSAYDIARGEVRLRPAASDYERAHELAHRHQFGSFIVVIAWSILGCIVLLRNWAWLALEIDASLRARRSMKRSKKWTPAARAEMWRGIRSYLHLLFKP